MTTPLGDLFNPPSPFMISSFAVRAAPLRAVAGRANPILTARKSPFFRRQAKVVRERTVALSRGGRRTLLRRGLPQVSA
jgi:hypothetical protein